MTDCSFGFIYSNKIAVPSLIVRLIDWFIHRSIDWLIDWICTLYYWRLLMCFFLQLLIPMLETSSFSRILELLDSVTTPEGRIPVIRIALMTARLNDADTALLKEKEIENLITRLLPDLLRKSLTHLQVASSVIYFNKKGNSLNTQTNITPQSFFQLCKVTLLESFFQK